MEEMEQRATDLTRVKLRDPRVDAALETGYQKVEQQIENALDQLSTHGSSSPKHQESSE